MSGFIFLFPYGYIKALKKPKVKITPGSTDGKSNLPEIHLYRISACIFLTTNASRRILQQILLAGAHFGGLGHLPFPPCRSQNVQLLADDF
jgi:hypothetical protein